MLLINRLYFFVVMTCNIMFSVCMHRYPCNKSSQSQYVMCTSRIIYRMLASLHIWNDIFISSDIIMKFVSHPVRVCAQGSKMEIAKEWSIWHTDKVCVLGKT